MSAAESLLSPHWYRVAHMKPQLRSGVRVTRQRLRGETWYVLSDPMSGRHHRFNDAAYKLVALCNGQRTIDEVWAQRVDADGDAAPTQAQAIEVFSRAFAANLFVGDVAPDARAVVGAQARAQAARRRAALNPLAFRVPLADPDRLLARHAGRLAWLFGRGPQAAIWVVVALGALLLALNAQAFAAYAHSELGSGRMWVAMWLVYPLIKALHEAAHAFAVKSFGGEVHEVGVTLLLLTPVPYVDASASTAFADRRERVVVGAAGVAVEALLATAALVLWLLLEPGALRDLAFAVAFVGGVSTLVVNANPLLRFDGYHVLCDAFELPNLALRSSRWWQQAAKRWLLRLPQATLAVALGERGWLVAYAPLAFAYRVLLLATLTAMVANWSAAAGLAVLALAAWAVALRPAWQALRWSLESPELHGARLRAGLAATGAAVLAGLGLFVLPVPHHTHAPGIVWLPDDAMVRPAVDGFVEQVVVHDGDIVQPGALLFTLGNEPLQVELAGVEAKLLLEQVERNDRFATDTLRSGLAADRIEQLATQRERLHARVAALEVRAAAAGRVALDSRLVAGRHLVQGEIVAQVLPGGAPLVRALIANDDIDAVRADPGEITVALARIGGGRDARATLIGGVPKASTALPSAALGEPAGGTIATDPADATGAPRASRASSSICGSRRARSRPASARAR